jgi:hypothetical protein
MRKGGVPLWAPEEISRVSELCQGKEIKYLARLQGLQFCRHDSQLRFILLAPSPHIFQISLSRLELVSETLVLVNELGQDGVLICPIPLLDAHPLGMERIELRASCQHS